MQAYSSLAVASRIALASSECRQPGVRPQKLAGLLQRGKFSMAATGIVQPTGPARTPNWRLPK